MKKILYSAIACICMMMTGCSEEQTTFDIDQVPGKAKLSGKVVYNEGTTVEYGKFVYKYVPAANLPVYVILSNSSLSGNLRGETMLTTTTDTEGNYSIEVPTSINGASVTIRTAEFEGKHRSVVKENNKMVTKSEDVIYSVTSNSVSLSYSGIAYKDFECTYRSKELIGEDYTKTATVKGMIGRNGEMKTDAKAIYTNNKVSGYNDGTRTYFFEPAPSIDAIVNVTYNKKIMTYNVTTNSSGEFTLDVPVQGFPADFYCYLDIVPVTNVTFKHYNRKVNTYYNSYWGYDSSYRSYEGMSLKGWYDPVRTLSQNCSFPVEGITCDLGKVKALVFKPYDNTADNGDYSADDFTTWTYWKSELDNN